MHCCCSDVNVCTRGLVMFTQCLIEQVRGSLRLRSSQFLLMLLFSGLYCEVLGSSRGRSWTFEGHVGRPVTSFFLAGKA